MRYRILVVLLLLIVPFAVQAQQGVTVAAAQEIIQMFVDGDYAGIYARFDERIKDILTQNQLQQAWEGIVQSGSALQEITGAYEDAESTVVTLKLQFERAALDAHIAFDDAGNIVLLNFTPSASGEPTPFYADQNAFTEREISVGEFALPGILTMPAGERPFPALVLISGSGSNDRDETIGPNKPFRDLAWGLASQGIATLRFDKRTFAAKDSLDLATMTMKDEYLDDAAAAIELLRQSESIDPARVFVLGHSLGGYVAPRIAAADPNIAGVIIASGLATPLPDAILRQNQYVLPLSGLSDAQQQRTLDAIQNLLDQINSLTPDSPDDLLLLGGAPAYWLDLSDYDPVALAATLPQPILVLQGERDYQVTVVDDLVLWQAGLADHANTTFKTYPDLNHIYVTGEGMGVPAEYDQPGNVSQAVIDDIAAWVKAH